MKLGRIISLLCLLSVASISVVADAQSPFEPKPAETQTDKILSISLIESYGPNKQSRGQAFTQFTINANGIAEEVSGFRPGRDHTPDFYGKFSATHFERLATLIEMYKTIDLPDTQNDTQKPTARPTTVDTFQTLVDLIVVRQKGRYSLRDHQYNPAELRAIEKSMRSIAQEVQWTLPRPKFSVQNSDSLASVPTQPEEQEKITSVSLTMTNTSRPPTVLGHHFTRLTLRFDGFAEEVSGLESARDKVTRRGRFSAVQFERLAALIAMCKTTELPDFQRGAGQADEHSLRLKAGSKGAGAAPDKQVALSAEGTKGKIALLAADYNASELWLIETVFRSLASEIEWFQPLEKLPR